MRPPLCFASLRGEDKYPHMPMILGLRETDLMEPRLKKHGFPSLKTSRHFFPLVKLPKQLVEV